MWLDIPVGQVARIELPGGRLLTVFTQSDGTTYLAVPCDDGQTLEVRLPAVT
jgi:hypothetical protein